MNIDTLNDQKVWDLFLSQNAPLSGGFLHSWAWGEAIKNRGRKIYRLGLFEGGLTGIALLVENPAAHKKYFYIPRGPVLKNPANLEQAVLEIKKFAEKRGAMFLRLEPAILKKDFKEIPRLILSRHIQPENTLLLDLSKSEDDLKSAMHEKTRYNIGLAERKGVKISAGNAESLDDFMRLLTETVKRDKIRTFGRDYFESILKSEDNNFSAKIWLATYEDKPIAAAFNVYFNSVATYLFGASSNESRNVMAPHLLQWKMITDAKTRGYKYYDFWGINPTDQNSPNYYPKWEGFSRFKRGFVEKSDTSLELLYAPCLELPISKFWYKIFRFAKKII